MKYLGDFPVSGAVSFLWNTQGQDGAAITRSTDGTLKIFKSNATAATWATERSSLAGVTQSEDFDSTGIHSVYIDLSDNTDAGFYAAGGEYQVCITGATVDTKTVNAVLASFSIERTSGAQARLKAGTVKVDVETIKTQAVTCAAGVTVLASVGTAATSTAQTGDCFPLVSTEVAEIYAAVITNAAGVDIAADIIAMKADTAAILLDTAEIGAAGAGLTALAQASAYTAARAGYIDKLNIAGTVLHTSLTMADADSLTADGIMDHIRKISWVIFSKLSVTDATGAWTLTKDDGTTSAATGTITDNAVTTIRSTPTWA